MYLEGNSAKSFYVASAAKKLLHKLGTNNKLAAKSKTTNQVLHLCFFFLFSCFEDKSRIQRDDKSENMSLHSCGFNEVPLTTIHSLKHH